jgi:hypothetical protein
MALTGFRQYVEVATTPRRIAGWLAAADVRDTSGPALLGAEYETDACITDYGGEFIDGCIATKGGFSQPPPGLAVPPGARGPTMPGRVKEFQGTGHTVTGDPFVPYAGVACLPNSLSIEAAQAQAQRRFAYVESRQVDYHLSRLITQNGNDIGDCPLSQMLANAEYAALNEYGGHALIAMSAPLVLCAASMNLLYAMGDGSLRTMAGTHVTTIAHNDAVTAKNFFLTGHVTLLRGSLNVRTATDMPNNQQYGLAERVYVPLIECMAYYGTATCDSPVTP